MNALPVVPKTTKTLLVLNNDAILREVVQACLSTYENWQVFSTGSLLEGLWWTKLEQPDAIVLDFFTPDADHILFLQELRSQPETQTIPVILMTAGAKWLNLQEFQEFNVAGAIDYLPQPTQLPHRIAKLLKWE